MTPREVSVSADGPLVAAWPAMRPARRASDADVVVGDPLTALLVVGGNGFLGA